jgi:tRNA-splicing endonuclease subunit Sen2
MADTTGITSADHGAMPQVPAEPVQFRGPSRRDQLNKLYALPAPLRTFPLPTFVPHNPLSLFHILFVWISQTINPRPAHFEPLYQGWFSPETRSVHVTDVRSIRGLWEQGFYGKGSLSRSEPQWLELQKTRAGVVKDKKAKLTAWERTSLRRAERQEKKWERARLERDAIDQKLSEEAQAMLTEEVESNGASESTVPDTAKYETVEHTPQVPDESVLVSNQQFLPPVSPMELLSLPNSNADLAKVESSFDQSSILCFSENFDQKFVERFFAPPVGPLELLALPNSFEDYLPRGGASQRNMESVSALPCEPPANGYAVTSLRPKSAPASNVNGARTSDDHGLGILEPVKLEETEIVGGSDTNDDTVDESVHSTHSEDTVETHDTPPNGSVLSNGGLSTPKIKRQKSVRFSPTVEKTTFIQSEPPSAERAATGTATTEEEPLAIRDQEHIQLTLEEAFFLSYALGALNILDPETKSPISNLDLFYLFRKTSYFPPLANPSLSPDDPFMTNYVVYHHFRSLGWVLRSGIKFSVDYMLYVRGPVFTHAEFGVLILPSYIDPYWSSNPFLQNYVKSKETRTWAWMNRIHRVITQVKKTLILCYVDIPKPLNLEEEEKMGIDAILARYKVREIVMSRFSTNRRRD